MNISGVNSSNVTDYIQSLGKQSDAALAKQGFTKADISKMRWAQKGIGSIFSKPKSKPKVSLEQIKQQITNILKKYSKI